MKFCKNKWNIKNFDDIDATVVFIELFNSAFDILNSYSINATGEKNTLGKENFHYIADFTEMLTQYVKHLKNRENNNFISVLDSNRKTGVIGTYMSLLKILYYNCIIAIYYSIM